MYAIKNNIHQSSNLLFTLLFCVLILSCQDNDGELVLPEEGDYYPLDESNQWEYERIQTYHCDCDDNGLVLSNAFQLHTNRLSDWESGWILVNDNNYQFSKVVKKYQSQYTERPPYRWEYIFLQDNKPINYSWWDTPMNIQFTVKQVNTNKNIDGIPYKNVIEIQETQWFTNADTHKTDASYIAHHFYAKDVGEIYTLQTFKNGTTIEFTLLKHVKL